MYGHFYRAGKGLENTFYLMVLVFSCGRDVKVNQRVIRQALEEMIKEFCGNVPYPLPFEFGVPYEPGTTGKIYCHITQAIIHRQLEAITLNTFLVA